MESRPRQNFKNDGHNSWTFYDYYLRPNRWVLSVGVYILFLTTFAYVATIMGTTIVVATGHYIGIVLDTSNFFMLFAATLFSLAALRFLEFF
ncbi:Hypothetical protein NTJ_14937 [Nesidiocoris tenuis]|uniref:Uncharacterized protein n=1 Tax=Nesidiocoris tenuis TaxID=355587 RepID=A0ABN7BCL3_9HEMI|nr:Hypothetical protein NTJ_14937 [Nesidiocoris tenuis]